MCHKRSKRKPVSKCICFCVPANQQSRNVSTNYFRQATELFTPSKETSYLVDFRVRFEKCVNHKLQELRNPDELYWRWVRLVVEFVQLNDVGGIQSVSRYHRAQTLRGSRVLKTLKKNQPVNYAYRYHFKKVDY